MGKLTYASLALMVISQLINQKCKAAVFLLLYIRYTRYKLIKELQVISVFM